MWLFPKRHLNSNSSIRRFEVRKLSPFSCSEKTLTDFHGPFWLSAFLFNLWIFIRPNYFPRFKYRCTRLFNDLHYLHYFKIFIQICLKRDIVKHSVLQATLLERFVLVLVKNWLTTTTNLLSLVKGWVEITGNKHNYLQRSL